MQQLQKFWQAAHQTAEQAKRSLRASSKRDAILSPCAWDEALAADGDHVRILVSLVSEDDLTQWHVRLSYPDAAVSAVQVLVAILPDQPFPSCRILSPRIQASFVHSGVVCFSDLGVGAFDGSVVAFNLLLQTLLLKLEGEGVEMDPHAPAYSAQDHADGERLMRESHRSWFELGTAPVGNSAAVQAAALPSTQAASIPLTESTAEVGSGGSFVVSGEVALFDTLTVGEGCAITVTGGGSNATLIATVCVGRGGVARLSKLTFKGRLEVESGGVLELVDCKLSGIIDVHGSGSSLVATSCTFQAVNGGRVMNVRAQAIATLSECIVRSDLSGKGGECRIESDATLKSNATKFRSSNVVLVFGASGELKDCTFQAARFDAISRCHAQLTKCEFIAEKTAERLLLVAIEEASYCTMVHCTLTNCSARIKESHLSMRDTKCVGTFAIGDKKPSGDRDGILVSEEATVEMTRCNVRGWFCGVKLQISARGILNSVAISECDFAITALSNSKLEVAKCTFTRNRQSVDAAEESHLIVTDCVISESKQCGVFVNHSSSADLRGTNTINSKQCLEVADGSTLTTCDGSRTICKVLADGKAILARGSESRIVASDIQVVGREDTFVVSALEAKVELSSLKVAGIVDVAVKCQRGAEVKLHCIAVPACRVGLIAEGRCTLVADKCTVIASACSLQSLQRSKLVARGGVFSGRIERGAQSTVDIESGAKFQNGGPRYLVVPEDDEAQEEQVQQPADEEEKAEVGGGSANDQIVVQPRHSNAMQMWVALAAAFLILLLW